MFHAPVTVVLSHMVADLFWCRGNLPAPPPAHLPQVVVYDTAFIATSTPATAASAAGKKGTQHPDEGVREFYSKKVAWLASGGTGDSWRRAGVVRA